MAFSPSGVVPGASGPDRAVSALSMTAAASAGQAGCGSGWKLAATPVDLLLEVFLLGPQERDAFLHAGVVPGEQAEPLGKGAWPTRASSAY
jgi:hypothetical protein